MIRRLSLIARLIEERARYRAALEIIATDQVNTYRVHEIAQLALRGEES